MCKEGFKTFFCDCVQRGTSVIHSQSYISVQEVPVSLVVHGHDVHGDVVLLVRVQTGDLYPHGRKHPPEGGKKITNTD